MGSASGSSATSRPNAVITPDIAALRTILGQGFAGELQNQRVNPPPVTQMAGPALMEMISPGSGRQAVASGKFSPTGSPTGSTFGPGLTEVAPEDPNPRARSKRSQMLDPLDIF